MKRGLFQKNVTALLVPLIRLNNKPLRAENTP